MWNHSFISVQCLRDEAVMSQQPEVRLEKKVQQRVEIIVCLRLFLYLHVHLNTIYVRFCPSWSLTQSDKRKRAHGSQTAEQPCVTPSQNRWHPRSLPSSADLKWPTKPTPAETPFSLAYPRFGLVEVRCCRTGGDGSAEIQGIKRGTHRSFGSTSFRIFDKGNVLF